MDGSKEPVDAITIVVLTKMRKGESPFFYLQQHHSLHKGFFQNNHVNHICPTCGGLSDGYRKVSHEYPLFYVEFPCGEKNWYQEILLDWFRSPLATISVKSLSIIVSSLKQYYSEFSIVKQILDVFFKNLGNGIKCNKVGLNRIATPFADRTIVFSSLCVGRIFPLRTGEYVSCERSAPNFVIITLKPRSFRFSMKTFPSYTGLW